MRNKFLIGEENIRLHNDDNRKKLQIHLYCVLSGYVYIYAQVECGVVKYIDILRHFYVQYLRKM